MARRSNGQVVTRKTKRGTVYALRFYVGGDRHYVTLGTAEEGWGRRRAEDELAATMAAVRAGSWEPPQPQAPVQRAAPEPTFHEFASEWVEANRHGWAERTVADYTWALSHHLLPHFAKHKLSAITIEEVDRYKAAKLRETERRQRAMDAGKPLRDKDGKVLRPLAPNAINKTLVRLAQVLEVAVEYGHIDRNPAKGRRRRVKGTEPRRSWVEPEQLPTLLDAAEPSLRPVIATLAGAGLRIGEACALNWGDVSLPSGTLTVRKAKTAAGEGREIDLPLGLHEELAAWRARSQHTAPADPVFVCGRPREGTHSRQTPRNVQARLNVAVKAANAKLVEAGIEPIGKVSPHSLRRTYASLRAALRDDPVYIAEQLGHRDARFTFRVYQRAAKRREKLSNRYLQAFDAACEWALMGTRGTEAVSPVGAVSLTNSPESAPSSQIE
jgi:integrase